MPVIATETSAPTSMGPAGQPAEVICNSCTSGGFTVSVQEKVAGTDPALSLSVTVKGKVPCAGGVPVRLTFGPVVDVSINHGGASGFSFHV